MSQASNAQSKVSRHSGQQNAPADVEDTASSVAPHGTIALPGMSEYAMHLARRLRQILHLECDARNHQLKQAWACDVHDRSPQ